MGAQEKYFFVESTFDDPFIPKEPIELIQSINPLETDGVYASLINFDQLYESVSDRTILINQFNMESDEDLERLDRLLYTEYQGDVLENIPSCDCGNLTGQYNLGTKCDDCKTVVTTVIDRPMESILWMKAPEGVKAFISPVVWTILSSTFKYRSVELIEWLCSPTYVPKKKAAGFEDTDPLFRYLKYELKWERSLNHFIENFDMIMDYLLTEAKLVKPRLRQQRVEQFIKENKHNFFTQHLPIPSRSIFIIEQTAVGTYVDQIMNSAIDAVRTITSLNSSITPVTDRVTRNRSVKVIKQLAEYYLNYTKENLGKKPGIFRKQVYGGRLDFSGRCVIVSLSEPHQYDEVHFPWGMSIMLFKTHLTSKLLRRGYTVNLCEELLMSSINRYNPIIDEIFKELISEGLYGKLGTLLQRNPSLVRGSAQQLYITKIKTDPEDKAVSLSTLCLAAPNADFDRIHHCRLH